MVGAHLHGLQWGTAAKPAVGADVTRAARGCAEGNSNPTGNQHMMGALQVLVKPTTRMPLPFSRKVVIPVWFAIFAIATIIVPTVNVFFSLFLLVMGLAGPMMVYVLWHDRPVTVRLAAQNIDTERRQATGNR